MTDNLVLISARVLNGLGPHLHDLRTAAGPDVKIRVPAGYSPPESVEQCFVGRVDVNLSAPINLKAALPTQIAERLMAMANDLMDAANRILDVPPVVPPDEPQAYVVRSRLTGDETPFAFHMLAVTHREHLAAKRHVADIVTKPASEVPEIAQLFSPPAISN